MAYSKKYSITVDNTKVSGSSDHSSFPMAFAGTYDGTGGEPDLRTAANGGDIQNTDGGGATGSYTVPADLAFYSDAALTTQLDHEVDYYEASTGKIVVWIKIPTLSYNADTTIYMAYNDASVTTSQEDLANLWSNYLGVFHFTQSSGTRYNSVSGGTNLSDNNTVTQADGVLGKAADFEDANSEWLSAGDVWDAGTGPLNVSLWIYPNAIDGGDLLIAKRLGSENGWRLRGNSQFSLDTGAAVDVTESAVVNNTWGNVRANWDGSTTSIVKDLNTPHTDSLSGNSNTATTIYVGGSGTGSFMDGRMDELRVSLQDLSNEWGETEYNNMNDPSSFYSLEETVAGGGNPMFFGGGGVTIG